MCEARRSVHGKAVHTLNAHHCPPQDIWCTKRFEPRPLLSKIDKNIGAFRRWTLQFMGPDSISYEEAVRRHAAETLGFPTEAIVPRQRPASDAQGGAEVPSKGAGPLQW